MGRLTYDRGTKVEIEDRLLAHIHVVIGTKLRRGEPFFFSWRDDVSVGGGRTCVWIHPAVPLICKYYGGRQPTLNPAWVDALMHVANSPAGLHVVPEPAEGSCVGREDRDVMSPREAPTGMTGMRDGRRR